METEVHEPIFMEGLSVSPGKAAARICLYSHKNYQNAALRIRRKEMVPEKELARYAEAISYCQKEISEVRARVAQKMGEAEAAVFDAHLSLLNDPAMITEVQSIIKSQSFPFEQAVEQVFVRYEELFADLDDAYLKERSTDIGEVKRRLLNFGYETEPGFVCSGQRACGRGFHSIIVAEELTAEMIMGIDLSRVQGVVTEKGGANGHAAILARAAGIPAVTGVKNAMDYARCGNNIYIDGATGKIQFHPYDELFKKYNSVDKPTEVNVEESLPGIQVFANCSGEKSAQRAIDNGADGIGLFRTEMLFLHEGKLLSETEQSAIYTKVCETMNGKPVTFRLLDIGGDKGLPFLKIAPEENPFLGFRGARFLLGNMDILRTQIRALLYTAFTHPIRIMIPMIVDRTQLLAIKDEILRTASFMDCPLSNIEIGIMFEVPSAIFQAEELLTEVDFGSIGSNDLMQYLFAVDRNNVLVAEDYDRNHPVLWKCMKIISEAGEKLGKKISLCGEIASYPGYAQRLYHLGIRSLSVSPQLIGSVRKELNDAVRKA